MCREEQSAMRDNSLIRSVVERVPKAASDSGSSLLLVPYRHPPVSWHETHCNQESQTRAIPLAECFMTRKKVLAWVLNPGIQLPKWNTSHWAVFHIVLNAL